MRHLINYIKIIFQRNCTENKYARVITNINKQKFLFTRNMFECEMLSYPLSNPRTYFQQILINVFTAKKNFDIFSRISENRLNFVKDVNNF